MALYTIKERRGSAADWALANTVLEDGQWGIELGTGKAKLGDGTTAWNDLAYFINEDLVSAIVEAAIGRNFVLLEADQTAIDVPPDTNVGALIARKA